MQPDNSKTQNDSQQSQVAEQQTPSAGSQPGMQQPAFNLVSQSRPNANPGYNIYTPYNINNEAEQATTTFLFGGSKNVSRFMKFTKASVVFFVIWLLLTLCLIGMSYLHYRYKLDGAGFAASFLIVTIISVINIIYFGWIRRELIFVDRIGLPEHTVRGATAVAYSFFYLLRFVLVPS